MVLLKGSGIRTKLAVLRKHPRFRSLVHFFLRSLSSLYKSNHCLANVLTQVPVSGDNAVEILCNLSV